jgi:hypothetical protein
VRLAALVLLAALAAIPSASAARGPESLRRARPADVLATAGSPREDWTVVAVNPATHETLVVGVNFLRNQLTPDVEWSAGLSYYAKMPKLAALGAVADVFAPRRVSGLVGFAFSNEKLAYAGGKWTLDFDEQGARLRLVLSNVTSGITATKWPIPFDFSAPVATSSANGTLDFGTLHLAISGWRASLDHTWGDYENSPMEHWDWAAVQSASGGWLVDGFETGHDLGPEKTHDGEWVGVLVHGSHGCAARVRRARWTTVYGGIESYVYPRALAASCGGMKLSLAMSVILNTSGTEPSAGVRGTGGAFGIWTEHENIP